MTTEELKSLFETSMKRSEEIEAKHRSGEKLTRRDCLELRECNNQLHTVAHEMWVQRGKPSDPEFELLRRPIPKRPLPRSMQGNYTTEQDQEVCH